MSSMLRRRSTSRRGYAHNDLLIFTPWFGLRQTSAHRPATGAGGARGPSQGVLQGQGGARSGGGCTHLCARSTHAPTPPHTCGLLPSWWQLSDGLCTQPPRADVLLFDGQGTRTTTPKLKETPTRSYLASPPNTLTSSHFCPASCLSPFSRGNDPPPFPLPGGAMLSLNTQSLKGFKSPCFLLVNSVCGG